jgi:serine/threonine protein kinase
MVSNLEKFGYRFEIRRELGSGASGQVYLAFDTYAQRDVALKITNPNLFSDEDDGARNRKMWLNETRLTGKLRHPFIVQVFEAGSTDNHDYLVMEFMPGGTLKQFASHGKLLPVDRLIDILYKICNALDYANKTGVLHRDIKPANILLDGDGNVKVSDFGAAFLIGSETTQVEAVGTLLYMAPEQFKKAAPSIQTDIYSTGVMAYQLLTGRHPFEATSHESLIYQKLHGDFLPLEQVRADLPQSLRFAVHRAMHRDRGMRYLSWKTFCDDLTASMPHLPKPDETLYDSSRFDLFRKLPFFIDFGDTEIWETVGITSLFGCKSGDCLVCEGDEGNSMYIIASGDASVIKGGVDLGIMHSGDFFGEIAYIRKSGKFACCVTAITAMEVVEIRRIA